MTATLPPDLREVFDRFITTEFVTVDGRGQPIAWPLTPYHDTARGCIDVTTGLGYPKKARDAEAHPQVAMLFSDATGSGLHAPPMVLVQGTAVVDDRDLRANAERYGREAAAKLPAAQKGQPPVFLRRHSMFRWYYDRIYIHVRPERVFVWRDGATAEPQLYGAHLEEVRSGHDELPDEPHATPAGGAVRWEDRIEELGSTYPTAALALVSPDGFPFAVRVPVRADRAAGIVRILAEPTGVPWQPGLACLVAHAHDDPFTGQTNFQVRGDLVERDDGWALEPRKLLGGFELPPGSTIERLRRNAAKVKRYRATAKRELARRTR